MDLKCKARIRITEVRKKTKAQGFGNLKAGDVMEISVPVKAVGSSRGRTYSVYLACRNLRTGDVGSHSFNQIGKILDCFGFEVLVPEWKDA